MLTIVFGSSSQRRSANGMRRGLSKMGVSVVRTRQENIRTMEYNRVYTVVSVEVEQKEANIWQEMAKTPLSRAL